MMHGHEKSRSAIVAVKPTTKVERSAASQSAARQPPRSRSKSSRRMTVPGPIKRRRFHPRSCTRNMERHGELAKLSGTSDPDQVRMVEIGPARSQPFSAAYTVGVIPRLIKIRASGNVQRGLGPLLDVRDLHTEFRTVRESCAPSMACRTPRAGRDRCDRRRERLGKSVRGAVDSAADPVSPGRSRAPGSLSGRDLMSLRTRKCVKCGGGDIGMVFQSR